MKIVEGYFEGEVAIPVIKQKCDDSTRFADYFVWQYYQNDEGKFIGMPSNANRLMGEDIFITNVTPGYYKFILWGVKP